MYSKAITLTLNRTIHFFSPKCGIVGFKIVKLSKIADTFFYLSSVT